MSAILNHNLKVVIASDHAGYNLKAFLIKEFQQNNLILEDLGCVNANDSVDYPDIAESLCVEIATKKADFGILICGSGVGVAIAANRFKEIRASTCYSLKLAKLSRQHNNANVLCLGARITKEGLALKIATKFLKTNFEGGRHEQRVIKLSK